MTRPHEWRQDPDTWSALFAALEAGTCAAIDGSLAPDFEHRLRVLHDDARRLSLDLREARGAALGPKKTTLRAVGAIVETAAVELGRAVERASK